MLAAGSAPRSTPSSTAPSPRVCLWYPRNQGFKPVVLLHNSFHPIHGFSPPVSKRELKPAQKGKPLLQTQEAAQIFGLCQSSATPTCRELNKQSASHMFSQQGPLVLSLSHVSSAPVSGHTLATASQS